MGAAMSALYSSIASAASAAAIAGGRGSGRPVSYSLRPSSAAERWYGAASAVGTIMFAFGGHSVLLEIQVCGDLSVDTCLKCRCL